MEYKRGVTVKSSCHSAGRALSVLFLTKHAAPQQDCARTGTVTASRTAPDVTQHLCPPPADESRLVPYEGRLATGDDPQEVLTVVSSTTWGHVLQSGARGTRPRQHGDLDRLLRLDERTAVPSSPSSTAATSFTRAQYVEAC